VSANERFVRRIFDLLPVFDPSWPDELREQWFLFAKFFVDWSDAVLCENVFGDGI
jgi:hypothetical protein